MQSDKVLTSTLNERSMGNGDKSLQVREGIEIQTC